ncbi:MAG: ATP-binding protein, partial [Bifidobacteriaceae bacterium]|nr:ATP-binding protein [Bifidobacteriaceae bacterium]
MTVRNPFTPTFGVDPPLLAGRDAEVAAIRRALANGPGDPARAALLTGARGAGKTVLLNAVERHARDQRWAVVSTTMRPGALAELTETILPRLLNAVAKDQTTVTGASVSVLGIGGGITRTAHEAYPGKPSFRSELEDLATLQQRTGGGVFITLDEVQRGAPDDLREVFHAIQHCFRQGLEVAFVAAGLPSAVSNLLNDEV